MASKNKLKKQEELTRLEADEPDIDPEDPRISLLKQEIDRLAQVSEAESLWALWRAKGILPPPHKQIAVDIEHDQATNSLENIKTKDGDKE